MVAELLERRFPEIVETQPELVAHHYAEAGLQSRPLATAIVPVTGERALRPSGSDEPLHDGPHIAAVFTGDAGAPSTRAAAANRAWSVSNHLARAWAPEVGAAYSRARKLCQQLGDNEDVFPVLFGLWRLYVARPDLALAQQAGEELQGLAERSDVEQTPGCWALRCRRRLLVGGRNSVRRGATWRTLRPVMHRNSAAIPYSKLVKTPASLVAPCR